MKTNGSGVSRSYEPAVSAQTATILLVEDEERVREVMEVILNLNGYQVLSAASANKALEIIETYQGTIHLMVTDFALPHMNGAQLAAELERLRPHTKVLYVSGFQKQELLDTQTTHGSNHLEFLQKPFMPEELELKVESLLAGIE
jgi:two-component system, cell cycle sensor histidine kinase and response regulator CckA